MIEVAQVEPGIFIYRWIDQINMQDAEQSFEQLRPMTRGQPYVAIIDMQQLKRIPADIPNMRMLIKREITHGLRGYVIYAAPRSVTSYIRPLTLLAPTTYKFSDDWSDAIQLARSLLVAQ